MQVKTTQIKASEAALRQVNEESESFLEMVESMRVKGVILPLIVVESSDADKDEFPFILCDGLHRFTAAKAAGLEEVPVEVKDYDEIESLEAQIIANVHRVDTKLADLSAGLCRILAHNPTMTEKDLAQSMSKSTDWISKVLGLNKLPESIKPLIDEGTIGALNAFTLSKVKDEKEVMDLLEDAQTKSAQEFAGIVRDRIKEIRKARAEGRDTAERKFVAVAKNRKASEIKEMQENMNCGHLLEVTNAQSAQDGFATAINWVLNLDPETIQMNKEKWEAREQAKAEQKAKKAKEKEALKLKKAQEKAEKAQKEASELLEATDAPEATVV